MLEYNKLYQIDALKGLKELHDNSIDCVITSPPYNKLGLLKGRKQNGGDWNGYIEYDSYNDNMSEDEYKVWQIDILNEVYRILKPKGSFFYNHKNRRWNKSEFSPLEWILDSKLNIYQTIIWNRKKDVNNSLYFFQPVYELIFWLTKFQETPKFYKKRLKQQKNIWTFVPGANLPHPAPFTEELVEQCILATTDEGDVVLDPFVGIGTTSVVSSKLGRRYIGFDLSETYIKMANDNIISGKIRKKNEL